jgi:chromosome segregation ATPase
VNCPKCGYHQEERLDCRKCGVVFSKFYALHNQEKPLQSDSHETSSPQPSMPSAEAYPPDIAEIRQNLRDVARRLTETEFERAERIRISAEVRSLNQKIQDLHSQFASSVEGLEKKAECLVSSALPTEEHLRKLNVELIESCLDPFLKRLDQVEQKAESRQKRNSREPEGDEHFQNVLRGLEQRMSALEKPEPGDADFPEQRLDETLNQEKILRQVDEIRVSLQNVTLKYSEIGELKKNHLVLLSKIESIQQEMDSSKKESSGTSLIKIPEIETEIRALRAEVRQAIKRLETLESSPLLSVTGIQSLEQEIDFLKETQANEPQRTRAAIAGLEASLIEKFSSVMNLPKDLKSINQRCQSLEENFTSASRDLGEADKKTAELGSGLARVRGEAQQLKNELVTLTEKLDMIVAQVLPEPRSSAEEDVRAIRDDIRRILEMVLRPVAG